MLYCFYRLSPDQVYQGEKMLNNRFFYILNLISLLLIVACATPQVELTPTVEQPVIPTATTAPTIIPEILPTPMSIDSFDTRVVATININYPDEIVFVQDFIWVKTDDGHLIQVDPVSNVVVGDIKVDTTVDPYHYCQGLGTDGESIWVCSARDDGDNRTIDVVRVDINSKSIVETIKVGKNFDQLNMPFLFNQIWVFSGSGDKLIGIDITTNQISSEINLGVRCFQLAVVDNFLMATCKLDNLVLKIDVENGEIIQQTELKSPIYIKGNEDGLWVTLSNSLVRLDSKSLSPVVTFTNLLGTSDIFVTKESVWVRNENGFLYRIDPATNQIVEQISVVEKLSDGSVLVTSDSIWTTASDNNVLMRLSLK